MEADEKTYWAKRCALTDNVVEHLINIVGEALPHTQAEISRLIESRNDAIDELEGEW